MMRDRERERERGESVTVQSVRAEPDRGSASSRVISQSQLPASRTMRLNITQARLGKTTRVTEGVFVIKTMVGIGDGGGHLTHDGLRQRFLLNLQDGREEEILQVFCPPGIA